MLAPPRAPAAARLPSLALAAALIGAWFATCTEYDSSLLVYSHPRDASVGDDVSVDAPDSEVQESSAVDVAQEAEADVVADAETGTVACDPCTDPALVRTPCPPDMADPPSVGEPIVFAMRTIRGGMSSAAATDWKNIGLDLDCVFTSAQGEPSMCKRVAADPNIVEDGFQGRDNSFGRNLGGAIRLMEMFGIIDSDVEVVWNEGLTNGTSGMLFELKNYGGGTNDPQVYVSVFLSRGVYDAAGQVELPANWDGNDLWTIDRESLTPADQAKFVDDAAYVTNDTIVAHLPEGLPLKFIANGAALEMSLAKSVFVMQMSPDHKHVTSGALAGVWYTSAALSAIDGYAAQAGICPDQPQYGLARDVIGSSSDIRVDLKPAPTLDCNGMSLGLAFTAEPAKLGAFIDPPPPGPSLCADGGADAAPD